MCVHVCETLRIEPSVLSLFLFLLSSILNLHLQDSGLFPGENGLAVLS